MPMLNESYYNLMICEQCEVCCNFPMSIGSVKFNWEKFILEYLQNKTLIEIIIIK